MRRKLVPILIAASALAAAAGLAWRATRGQPRLVAHPGPGSLANFELIDTGGNAHELYRYTDVKAIVFLARAESCAPAGGAIAALERAGEDLAPQGVAFLGLDSLADAPLAKVAAAAKRDGVSWPVLRDPSQTVARALGITDHSEALVVSTSSWKVEWRGPSEAGAIRAAVQGVLAGRAPASAATGLSACPVKWAPVSPTLTYGARIGKLIRDKCVNCHSEAGQSPPYFTGYETLPGWAAMMRETVMTGRMPVWGVDAEPGVYQNDNSLSPAEKRDFIAWIDAGLPRGEGPDPLTGYVPAVSNAPTPGATFVAPMKEEFEVPPGGFMEYHYFDLGPLPRDMWVAQVEAHTDNPRAMHHATLNVAPEPLSFYERLAEELRGRNAAAGFAFGSEIWMGRAMKRDEIDRSSMNVPVPAGSPYKKHELIRFSVYSMYGRNNKRIMPPHTARFLPKGYHLILETHHHETGKPEREKTTLYFYEIKKTKAIKPLRRFDQIGTNVIVPPYAKNFRFDLPTFIVEDDLKLLACNSHMHIRGRALHAWAELPDKQVLPVLTVSSFDYTWHSAAQMFFHQPLSLPAGTRIFSYAVIDNSPMNPYNPDPSQQVVFGQTLDKHEMPKLQCVYYLDKD